MITSQGCWSISSRSSGAFVRRHRNKPDRILRSLLEYHPDGHRLVRLTWQPGARQTGEPRRCNRAHQENLPELRTGLAVTVAQRKYAGCPSRLTYVLSESILWTAATFVHANSAQSESNAVTFPSNSARLQLPERAENEQGIMVLQKI
jgi:hypothetical protein